MKRKNAGYYYTLTW
jgi:cytosolic carboxypeptidase protein 2/3